jgi:Domain of unknown function (DUF4340)
MNQRQLTVLAVLAVIAVAATFAVLRTSAPTVESDRRGERVLRDLAEKANTITGITVREGADTLALARRDERFVAAESGYPIKPEPVRDLVASSAQLTYEEARTADPARYADLGLADPGATKGAGKEIAFTAAGGTLGDLVVGNRDSTVGGAAGGEFVRLAGAPQTFLVRGSVQLPSTRSEWFVPVDFDVKRDEIKKIELAGGGRSGVTATAEKPGELKLADVPEKRTADTFKVSRLMTLVDSFAFQDVRRETKPADDARRMVVDADDGLRLVFTGVGDVTEGWVRIAAEATNDAKQDKAKAIVAKVAGYDFRLPSNQTEILAWTITDVTDEQKDEPPPAPPGARMPGMPPGMQLPPGMSLPPGAR